MTIKELCKLIGLNKGIEKKVILFSENFDFHAVQVWLNDFKQINKRKDARLELQSYLGKDEGNIKILSCMLKGAADLYDFYQENEIEDKIYIDTMKCFTRFLNESYERTGTYCFDREWWTTRQVGGHLFRIGELEYEMIEKDQDYAISIHIPSDADFRKEACDRSLSEAKQFFKCHFPQYSDCEYRCHSWLLAPELKEMLEPDSNILNFQKRFQISVNGKSDLEFLEWIYHTYDKTYSLLPEHTRLQRRLKNYLLNGGMLSDCNGILVNGL